MITAARYEDWMKDEVISLFMEEYGVSYDQFLVTFNAFYEAPYQKNKAIRMVALEDRKVVGFLSFFYWPMAIGTKTYQSFQLGNGVVHADFRGKGVFAKLIAYLENNHFEMDFAIGFPVEASRNSFVRMNWKNPINLRWFIKWINPLSLIIGFKEIRYSENGILNFTPDHLIEHNLKNEIHLDYSKEFAFWREALVSRQYLFLFTDETGNKIQFLLKNNVRKRVIKEVIVGKVLVTVMEQDVNLSQLYEKGLKALIKSLRKSKNATLLSLAVNEDYINSRSIDLRKAGLKRIEKQIYFIHKSPQDLEELMDKSAWNMHRADIDTW